MLSSFLRPLPDDERARREQLYSGRESGYLTRETLMRVLLGEFGYP